MAVLAVQDSVMKAAPDRLGGGGARTVNSQTPVGSYDDHQRAAVYSICPSCGRAFYVTNKPIPWICAGCSK
jgi:hypothetical protein